ncbi:MAG: prepilin-type N-terminal cleavage/methylation domain-containing protein [Desulfohalobiaceae bacterium]
MVMASLQISTSHGFTLLEVLVGLVLTGLLGAMIAATASQNILSSQALLQQGQGNTERTVLRRILHRDIQNMQLGSSLQPTNQGFRLKSGHNLLLNASLQVRITWSFSQGELVRREEKPGLGYIKQQTLCRELDSFKLEFLPAEAERWVELQAWLMDKKRSAPAALRIQLDMPGKKQIRITERVPRHE